MFFSSSYICINVGSLTIGCFFKSADYRVENLHSETVKLMSGLIMFIGPQKTYDDTKWDPKMQEPYQNI